MMYRCHLMKAVVDLWSKRGVANVARGKAEYKLTLCIRRAYTLLIVASTVTRAKVLQNLTARQKPNARQKQLLISSCSSLWPAHTAHPKQPPASLLVPWATPSTPKAQRSYEPHLSPAARLKVGGGVQGVAVGDTEGGVHSRHTRG